MPDIQYFLPSAGEQLRWAGNAAAAAPCGKVFLLESPNKQGVWCLHYLYQKVQKTSGPLDTWSSY